AIAEPVVMMFPVVLFNEVAKCPLHRADPPLVFRQAVKPHQGKGSLSLVINNAKLLFHLKAGPCQYMCERAVLRLHMQDSQSQLFHQRSKAVRAKHGAVFRHCQDGGGVSSQLDLIAGIDHKSLVVAVSDELGGQIIKSAFNRRKQLWLPRLFPGLQHRIGRAGMAQSVVGWDLAIKTRMVTIDEDRKSVV